MKFNQDFIEQVRDANNIVDIIGQYTDLKGRGHQFMGLCPFPDHNEKSPSFSVSDNKQVYHCFGCKKSGNVYTFLQNYSGLSFTDAVEFLARRANIPLPEVSEDSKEKSNKTTLLRINKFAAAFFHRQLKSLPATHAARQYLEQRGIDEGTIDEMKLGYAGDEWSDLYYFFRDKHVPLDEAEKLGLIKPKKNGYFDLFHHRLIFPILSTQEDVIGFGGRVIDKEQKPKYLNSPESPLFHKGRTFYGLNFAAKHIRQADRAVIVEGYMDQIALYRAGIKNVVATLGTALTEDHAYLIQKHTSQVVLMFDGDFAGMNAAERSLLPMFAQGLCPLAVFLPESLDPDDFVKKYGAPALQEKINQAQELFVLMISDWLKDFKFTANEKMLFMQKVKPFLNAISDRGLKDLYVKTVAQRLMVEVKWVVRELQDENGKPQTTRIEPRREKPRIVEENPYELEQWQLKGSQKDELYLLGMVLNSPELLTKVIDSGVYMKVSSESVKKLLSLVIQRYGQNPSDFDKLTPLVVSRIKDPEELTGLFKFWSLDGAEDEALKTTTSCIKRIEARHLKLQSEIIAGQLQNGPQGESLEKLEQIMNIHKNRIQLNRPVKGEP